VETKVVETATTMGTTSELISHRVALFYECRTENPGSLGALSDVAFEQVAAASGNLNWINPARLASDDQRSLLGGRIWQHEALTVSHDLHPAIRSIFTGPSKDDTAPTPCCYRLTDKARNLITGLYAPAAPGSPSTIPAKATRKRGFIINLGPKAASRIGMDSQSTLAVYLVEVTFLCFRTGVGIAVVEVEIDIPQNHPAPLAVLIEAAHLLSDERRLPLLTWKPAEAKTDTTDMAGAGPAVLPVTAAPGKAVTSKKDRFHLSDLLRPLIGDGGYQILGGRRIFSYTTAVTHSQVKPERCREIAFRLSRHYNYAYAPQLTGSGTEIIEPFTNVIHATSLEGAATIVTLPAEQQPDGSIPEFLTNWFDTAYRPAYLPIVIVAYHEHLALLDFAQSAAVDLDFDKLADTQIAALKRLCHRFLAFRLRYRPAQVSFITMHNEFSNGLRRALGSESLSQKAAQDAIEAEMRLSRHVAELEAMENEAAQERSERRRKELRAAERKREHRWAWHGTLVACLLAILAVLNFTEQMSETPATFIQKGFAWSALEASDRIKLIGLAVALICGIAGGYINWFRLQQGHGEDEVLEDAKRDQFVERPSKGRRTDEKAEKTR